MSILIPVRGKSLALHVSFLLKANISGYAYGRTIEFGIPLKSALIVMPRNLKYGGVGVNGKPGTGLNWKTRYAATDANVFGMPILIDGMNEAGLIGGLLNAPNKRPIKTPRLQNQAITLHPIKC